ncbi:hypothetical protein CCR75_004810 [Bremia lactucae]|uniref:Jacalin-type lectin domain-containing protein n=1 Tax=Bremia lactucae TaxID=4779 RepID=A0A976FIZ6_BRELC|nr:hypothetical protein CCR75_004810 [Bremia lactucae]
MVSFFYQIMATVVLLSGSSNAENIRNLATTGQVAYQFGLTHGSQAGGVPFSVQPAQNEQIATIRLNTGRRVDGMTIIYQQISTKRLREPLHIGTSYLSHGGKYELNLLDGEFVSRVEVHAIVMKKRKRISFIQITTSKGRSIWGGTETNDKVTFENGKKLAGFHGTAGAEIDSIGPIWMR